jgi:hypothetical protein
MHPYDFKTNPHFRDWGVRQQEARLYGDYRAHPAVLNAVRQLNLPPVVTTQLQVHTNKNKCCVKNITRPDGWSMAKDAALGGRGNWSPAAMGKRKVRLPL